MINEKKLLIDGLRGPIKGMELYVHVCYIINSVTGFQGWWLAFFPFRSKGKEVMPMTVFESLLIMLTFGALVLYLNNRWKYFLIKYKSILYVNNRMKRFLIKYKSHLKHIFPLNINHAGYS